MKSKAWILPLFLAASLSMIYFLPRVGAVAQSAIKMDLPKTSGDWSFEKQVPSKDEIATLAKDTSFSKAICLSVRPGESFPDGSAVPDRVDLSIVLSGADINNSIHRPERCMPAQGHNITGSGDQILKLSNGREFATKRLVSIQSVKLANNQEREEYAKLNCLTYYFFVGHDKMTNSHLALRLMDIKDRLVQGVDQRWAYISVSMWYGDVPWIKNKKVTEQEVDTKIQKFLIELSENQIDWSQIKE